ncbi:MAG: helix-turn-helix domain-containing protein [Oscillospiraceae bacterium]|nr:helix-turn-helix domain-containing protein [Oscillospiraceae bacterium]
MAEKREAISADMEELGANIKRYRRKKKLTLEGLAGKLGGTYNAKILSEYEHGYRNVGSRAIIDISNALEVTPNEIFPAWLVESQQDEALTDFMLLDSGNQEAVRTLIKTLLANQKQVA